MEDDTPAAVPSTERVLSNTRMSLSVKRVSVRVVQGPDLGLHAELGEQNLIVGRAPDCGMRLQDPTVSSMHLDLSLRPDGVWVRNLGSSNGVHIGGARVEEATVEPTARLIIGRTVLELEPTDAEARLPFAAVQRAGELVGRSLKMQMVFGLIHAFAGADAPVLIEGATGTGKELAARAIHDLSSRAQGPFEVVDCGAISENLMEAELFGVMKGAYTDASESRAGVFERASGGTVVLDEIGELRPTLQPKLLGVLERGVLRRLGDQRTRNVSVRLIATTNRVLGREVAAGRFRQDLFFRLAVLRLAMPVLRERPEDLPLLARAFLGREHSLPAASLRLLEAHPWPGNVRELRNVLERAAARTPSGAVTPIIDGDGAPLEPLDVARRQFERDYLKALMARAGQNVGRAAKLAGLSRQGLYGLLTRAGLRGDSDEE